MRRVTIPVYVINLKNRIDRKQNILKNFSGRDEFALKIINPIYHEAGTLSLWSTLKDIVNTCLFQNEPIILCEDDHEFTMHYDKDHFLHCIAAADRKDADILLGGVSWFTGAVRVSPEIYWVEKFTGLQFTVIYPRFFKAILESGFSIKDIPDRKIASIAKNKFLIHPFISVQKEFGYSDLTHRNNNGVVEELFKKCASTLEALFRVQQKHKTRRKKLEKLQFHLPNTEISIPVYVVNLAERVDRVEHIKKEFFGKQEFELIFIAAHRHKTGAYGLWCTIREIVEKAIDNEDDVIIICEDDHQFTTHYSKEQFISSVIDAHGLGADILIGGISHFGNCFYISEDKFWMNYFYGCQFMVIYKHMFRRILDEPFDLTVTTDGMLSKIASHKIGMFPFISIQKYFGYSDINPLNGKDGHIDQLFESTAKRLQLILTAFNKYQARQID